MCPLRQKHAADPVRWMHRRWRGVHLRKRVVLRVYHKRGVFRKICCCGLRHHSDSAASDPAPAACDPGPDAESDSGSDAGSGLWGVSC
jgi:hypothetical protein